MKTADTGSQRIEGNQGECFVLEWGKYAALSDEFADKLITLAPLGIKSFKDVELEFLAACPQALQEDPSLDKLKGLEKGELEKAIESRLYGLFHARPENNSEAMQKMMAGAFYYLITVKAEESDQVLGFITFLGGGPLSEDEYKITILAIDQAARRKGLASHLVTSLKKMGIAAKKVRVSTRPSNETALKAYTTWGFIEDQTDMPSHFIKGHWTHLVHTT